MRDIERAMREARARRARLGSVNKTQPSAPSDETRSSETTTSLEASRPSTQKRPAKLNIPLAPVHKGKPSGPNGLGTADGLNDQPSVDGVSTHSAMPTDLSRATPGQTPDKTPGATAGTAFGGTQGADAQAPANEPQSSMPLAGPTIELPLEQLNRLGYLTPDRPKDRLSEEFRRLKRPILKNLEGAGTSDEHRNIIMVTSSVTGEGKTYTAINLAMSLALEQERTVVLIDADVLKGTASTLLGIKEGSSGLLDLLDHPDETLDASLFETNVADLKFVPAGRRRENASELLAGGRMRELINELAKRHDDRIVVLDCSPILQTNEANVLMDHAGQVVFVVASEETDQRLVQDALERFDEAKPVGILLNKAATSGAVYDYDYGYR